MEYQARYRMNAVFREICELGHKKFRNTNSGDTNKVMTLKKAVIYLFYFSFRSI